MAGQTAVRDYIPARIPKEFVEYLFRRIWTMGFESWWSTLTLALCWYESELNPSAVGGGGRAIGIAQFHETLWVELGHRVDRIDQRWDAEESVRCVQLFFRMSEEPWRRRHGSYPGEGSRDWAWGAVLAFNMGVSGSMAWRELGEQAAIEKTRSIQFPETWRLERASRICDLAWALREAYEGTDGGFDALWEVLVTWEK